MSSIESEKFKFYDYAFLGLGCGNSLLLLEMERSGLLVDKNILILEPNQKTINDKTFCFWMDTNLVENHGIKDLIRDEWSNVCVVTDEKQALEKFNYFHIPALSLYEKVRELVTRHKIKVLSISFEGSLKQEGDYTSLWIQERLFHAKCVFDNRPPSYAPSTSSEVQLFQSFYGWEIRALNKLFDATTFTMMDFNIPQNGSTQFMYVLPFNEKTALFEMTRFGEEVIKKDVAESIIHDYLTRKGIEYKIEQKEQGVIRMFNSPILETNEGNNVFQTGERGGNLKPSTGYSFVRSLNHAKQITTHLIEKKSKKSINKKRFAYYDKLLLQILKYSPHRGKDIFTRLFTKNKVETVLRFLDEKTSPKEEFTIFTSLPIIPFKHAFLRDSFWMLRNKIKNVPLIFWMSVSSLIAYSIGVEWFVYTLLITGMLLIGIPHGAVDHLYSVDSPTNRKLAHHILQYLGIGCLVLFLFWLSPLFGLVLFLLYSSWHFGETDFMHWRFTDKVISAAWGVYFLGGLLVSHSAEMQMVIQEMDVYLTFNSTITPIVANIWLMVGGLFFSLKLRKSGIIFGVISLFILQYLPLIPAFAIFFIGQHSIHGWRSLKTNLDISGFKLWRIALPFTFGACFLFYVLIFFTTISWGQAFIFLAALSFPHVYFTARYHSR